MKRFQEKPLVMKKIEKKNLAILLIFAVAAPFLLFGIPLLPIPGPYYVRKILQCLVAIIWIFGLPYFLRTRCNPYK